MTVRNYPVYFAIAELPGNDSLFEYFDRVQAFIFAKILSDIGETEAGWPPIMTKALLLSCDPKMDSEDPQLIAAFNKLVVNLAERKWIPLVRCTCGGGQKQPIDEWVWSTREQ